MAYEEISVNDSATNAVAKANTSIRDLDSRVGGLNRRVGSLEGGSVTPSPGGSVGSDRVLNILHLGNSHTEDAWAYVPYMLLEYGIKVRMAIFRASGTSISSLRTYYQAPFSTNSALVNTKDAWGKIWYIDTTDDSDTLYNGHPSWMLLDNNGVLRGLETQGYYNTYYTPADHTVQEAVLFRGIKWDLVGIQDNYSIMCEAIRDNNASVGELIGKISADLPCTPLFGLQIVHTQGGERTTGKGFEYNSLSNHKMYYLRYPFDMYFPSGTAIFNAREFSEITSVCYTGDVTESTGIHLSEGLPCYISSLSCIEALFRKFYPWLSVKGNLTRVDNTWLSGKLIPGANPPDGTNQHSGWKKYVETSESNAELAQWCAVLANDHPWDIMGTSAQTRYANDNVTVQFIIEEGLQITGIGKNAVRQGINQSISLPKHCNVGGEVSLAFETYNSQYTPNPAVYVGEVTMVKWTMNGVVHQIPIVNNKASFLIKDICDDIVIECSGDTEATYPYSNNNEG